MGSVDDIVGHAHRLGLDVQTIALEDHFRCGGSQKYLDWVQRALSLKDEGPLPWSGDSAFDVRVADTPEDMERWLALKEQDGYSARLSAGYCWPWSDPRPDGTLVPDVSIGGWERPWNLKGDRRVGDAPPAALWATERGGFGQVGCVYTAQGFEYDWSGVILGPDLVWRTDRFATIRGANRDPDFRNRTQVDDRHFDRLVRNVYKVLLTRGMVGTVVYSTDPETRQALRDKLTIEPLNSRTAEKGKPSDDAEARR